MNLIADFDPPAEVLVTGASSGIGLALTRALLEREAVAHVTAVSRGASDSEALSALQECHPDRLQAFAADLCNETDRARLAEHLAKRGRSLQLVINAAGLLHAEGIQPEKALSQLQQEALERCFAINAFAPILLLQALLPRVPRDAPAVLASVSARVGSIGDNRLGGWYSYRAAKAAQNQLLRTLAIELSRSHRKATVLALHPGTVDTPLSKPFQARVPEEKLFSPEQAAQQLLEVIANARPERSGSFLAYDGSEIPW
jgi:NAD(P)-dependent dehydrogenase (short-subunit alcohol dehydrogenase family)